MLILSLAVHTDPHLLGYRVSSPQDVVDRTVWGVLGTCAKSGGYCPVFPGLHMLQIEMLGGGHPTPYI